MDKPSGHCLWWTIKDPDELASVIWDHLRAQQKWRMARLADIEHLQATYEREADTFDQVLWDRLCESFNLGDTTPPCLNVTKAGIDTVASRLIDTMPAVQCAPYNLPYDMETEEREMSDALNGTLNTDEAHDEVVRALIALLRDGITFIWPMIDADCRVEFQKLEYYECFWDPQDARKGKPRSFHVWLRVSKSELLAQWEQYRGAKLPDGTTIPDGLGAVIQAIKDMPEAAPGDMGDLGASGSIYEWRMRQRSEDMYSITADQIHVVHSWHLPGGPKSDDGLHTITMHPGGGAAGKPATTVKSICAMREKWKLPRMPVVWGSPYPHNEGIDGNGIGHLLRGQQFEVDRLSARVTNTSKTCGQPHLIVDESWELEKAKIADQDVNFIKLRSGGMLQAPIVWKPEPVSAQDLALIDRYLGPWSLGLAGISTALAQAGSELGLNASGIALVEENRKQDDRMTPVERQLRKLVRNLAEATMDVIERQVEIDPKFALVWQDGNRSPRKTEWAKARLPRESYSIRLEEVNIFGQSKSARVQTLIELGDRYPAVQELVQNEVLGSADLRKASRFATADERYASGIIQQLMNPRETEPSPDVHTPHALMLARLLAVHRDAVPRKFSTPKAKTEILRRFERYMAKCIKKMDELKAASAPAGPAGLPPGPGAIPMDAAPMAGGMPMGDPSLPI